MPIPISRLRSHTGRLGVLLSLCIALGAAGKLDTAPDQQARTAPLRAANAQELAQAIRAARPGDTILMADGDWVDADIFFEGSGTAEKPITLRAQTPGKVILRGRSRLRIAGSYLVVDGLSFRGGPGTGDPIAFRTSTAKTADHCRLTNTAIIDYNPPDKKTDTKWLSLYGTYNRVDHCYLAGKTNLGQTLVVWVGDQPNFHQVDHNHFGPRPPLGENGGETVRVGTSNVSMNESRTTVEENYFSECSGEAEIISSKSCYNRYRANTFVGCGGALTLRHGNYCTVQGNFFFGKGKSGTGGIRVIGEDHQVFNNYLEGLTGDGGRAALSVMDGIPNSPLAGYFQVKRALIAFNTFIDCKASLVLGLGAGSRGATLPPENCTIANNLIARGQAPVIRQLDAPSGLTWKGNLVHGGELGIPPTAGITLVDAQLRRDADGLWRPSAASPARGAGEGDFPFVKDDFDGQPRPARKDIGCDQSSTAPVRSRPLTPKDVGPAWMRP
jgi:poly(beta-D-mannuronate) lyase